MSDVKATGRPGRQPLPPGFGSLWSTVVLDLIGFGIVLPILPLWAEDLGASARVVGVILAAYSVAQLIGAPVLGRLSDRIGRRPLLVFALAGSALGHVVTGVAGSVTVLILARLLDGFSGSSVSVAFAAVADIAEPAERPRLFGLLGAGFAVGLILGPALGTLAALGGTRVPFFAAAGLCSLNALTAWWRLPETAPAPDASRPRDSIGETLRLLWRGGQLGRLLLVSLLAGLAFNAFESTFSLVGERRLGMTVTTAGLLFAGLGIVVATTQGVVVPRLVKQLGSRRAMRLSLVLLVVGCLLLMPSRGWALLIVGTVILVIGYSLLSPAISSELAGLADPSRRGATFGLSQSTSALSRLIGPVAATTLLDLRGTGAPYLAGAVLGVAALLVVLVLVTPEALEPAAP